MQARMKGELAVNRGMLQETVVGFPVGSQDRQIFEEGEAGGNVGNDRSAFRGMGRSAFQGKERKKKTG